MDLCYFGKDPDPWIRTEDPAPFVRGLQEAEKNVLQLYSYYFSKVHLHNFFNVKSHTVK